MQDLIHCFEERGLGKAPFTYLYCQDSRGSSCEYCGTSIRYKFFLRSADGKQFFVGSDCIEKSGDFGLIKYAKNERKKIAKEQRDARNAKKYAERQAEWAKQKQDKFDQFLASNPTLTPVLNWAKDASGIAQDIYSKLVQWGSISENQIQFLIRLYEQTQIVKDPCPSGKLTIEGTIVSLKWVDTQFGSQEKMIVEAEQGYRVYGTVPKILDGVEKGTKVRFNATVEPSPTDQSFGFFSRPTQAVLV